MLFFAMMFDQEAASERPPWRKIALACDEGLV
jgi:hypothetical protein